MSHDALARLRDACRRAGRTAECLAADALAALDAAGPCEVTAGLRESCEGAHRVGLPAWLARYLLVAAEAALGANGGG